MSGAGADIYNVLALETRHAEISKRFVTLTHRLFEPDLCRALLEALLQRDAERAVRCCALRRRRRPDG